MEYIDGKKIAEKINKQTAKQVYNIIKQGYRRPSLAIILAGDRSDSSLYVSLKEAKAKEVGIDTSLYKVINEEELVETLDFLNRDDFVDGILIQLPLPKNYNTDSILKKINPLKDVDAFCLNRPSELNSPVILAIKASLDDVNYDFKQKSSFLFYNSNVFRDEVYKFLKSIGMEYSSISYNEYKALKDSNNLAQIKEQILKSSVIISAVGQAHFIDSDLIPDNSLLIDIGIVSKDKKVFGDFNKESLAKRNITITPVPGGVGPMTVAFVLNNTLLAYKIRNKYNG